MLHITWWTENKSAKKQRIKGQRSLFSCWVKFTIQNFQISFFFHLHPLLTIRKTWQTNPLTQKKNLQLGYCVFLSSEIKWQKNLKQNLLIKWWLPFSQKAYPKHKVLNSRNFSTGVMAFGVTTTALWLKLRLTLQCQGFWSYFGSQPEFFNSPQQHHRYNFGSSKISCPQFSTTRKVTKQHQQLQFKTSVMRWKIQLFCKPWQTNPHTLKKTQSSKIKHDWKNSTKTRFEEDYPSPKTDFTTKIEGFKNTTNSATSRLQLWSILQHQGFWRYCNHMQLQWCHCIKIFEIWQPHATIIPVYATASRFLKSLQLHHPMQLLQHWSYFSQQQRWWQSGTDNCFQNLAKIKQKTHISWAEKSNS